MTNMIYKDFDNFIDDSGNFLKDFFAIGWLDKESSFDKGGVAKEDKKNLEKIIFSSGFYKSHFLRNRGFATCSLCSPRKPITMIFEGKKRMLGDFLVMIPNITGEGFFISPSLIVHYVENHEYSPPRSYIESLRAAQNSPCCDAESIFNVATGRS